MKHEPSQSNRTLAHHLADMKAALLDEGFSEAEILAMLIGILTAGMNNAAGNDQND